MAVKLAVIYYSATGTTYRLARGIEEGAGQAGAEVRFRKVRELAPEKAISSNQGWTAHRQGTQNVAEATLDDLVWADAIIFGTPTPHGGQETTIIALNNTFYHWGAIIVAPGYIDPIQFQAGNPYGASFTTNNGQLKPDDVAMAAAKFQGRRVVAVTAQFLAGQRQ